MLFVNAVSERTTARLVAGVWEETVAQLTHLSRQLDGGAALAHVSVHGEFHSTYSNGGEAATAQHSAARHSRGNEAADDIGHSGSADLVVQCRNKIAVLVEVKQGLLLAHLSPARQSERHLARLVASLEAAHIDADSNVDSISNQDAGVIHTPADYINFQLGEHWYGGSVPLKGS